MSADRRVSRRHALLGTAAACVALPAAWSGQQTGTPDTLVARLRDPGVAGKPRARVTDYENDPFVVGIEGRLRCTCGCNLSVYTCRTTDFTCEISPALHRQVVGLVGDGKTEQEILDAFVMQYGETVLMAPRKEGFNLAAYFVPGLAIVAAGGILLRYLVRQTRHPVTSMPGGAAADGPGAPSPESRVADPITAARIAAEQEKLDF